MSERDGHHQEPAWRLVLMVCIAQTLVQIGAFFWPALLPQLAPQWSLSNSAAGWITAAFYGAYMLAVPVLVTLTDRVDPKRIYLLGVGLTVVGHLLFGLFIDGFWSALACRALTGIGWAGTYMTGLKLLADRVDAKMMSRATAGHAASIGLSGALSFATGDWLARLAGWQSAFLAAALSALIAWIIISVVVPRQQTAAAKPTDGLSLYDFRPVLQNRSAMAYAMAYSIHTLEMSALRGWGVAFLAYVAASTGTNDPTLSPAVLVTTLGLIGTAASILGNEAAIKFGRRRLVQTAMLGSVDPRRLHRFPRNGVLSVRCNLDLVLRPCHLAQFFVPDSWCRRHCRAVPSRRHTGRSLVARLCGRLHWTAAHRRDSRPQRRDVHDELGARIRLCLPFNVLCIRVVRQDQPEGVGGRSWCVSV